MIKGILAIDLDKVAAFRCKLWDKSELIKTIVKNRKEHRKVEKDNIQGLLGDTESFYHISANSNFYSILFNFPWESLSAVLHFIMVSRMAAQFKTGKPGLKSWHAWRRTPEAKF